MSDQSKIADLDRIVMRHVSEALLAKPENVRPESRLFTDLSAESIDIADIRFRLEDHLHIKIDQRKMTDALGSGLSPEQFDRAFTVQFIIDYLQDQIKGS